MADEELKVGDTVRLNVKNSPDMVVQKVVDNGSGIWATWFSGKKLERAHFATATLVRAGAEADDADAN